jgi:hypothetical protein
MSTLTSYASTSARDSAVPASSNTGLCIFRSDTKAIEVSDGTNYLAYNYDSTSKFNNYTALLDGANDYLTVPSSTAFDFGTGEFSITFWMRITSRTTYGGLVTKDSADRLKFQNANHVINLRMSTTEYSVITYNPGGTNTSLLNSWHHIAIIRSGTSLKGYVDNVEYGSHTAVQSFSLNSQQWGKNFNDYVGGQLDEIAVFDYGLSTSELSEIYNNGVAYDISSNYSGTAPLSFYRCGDDASDTDSGGGAVNSGDIIGTIKNVVNPGTHDMGQINDPTYSDANNPV